MTATLRGWIRPRAYIVGTALGTGLAVGVLAMGVGVLYTGSARASETTVFALGALVLGFGVLGWSGSIIAGPGIENMQRYMDTRSNWSERDSRRAMSRIAAFGAGVMAGTTVLAATI